ncbi:MAG: 3-keto-disaccharide hydrolase [Planctomycetota bacterium]
MRMVTCVIGMLFVAGAAAAGEAAKPVVPEEKIVLFNGTDFTGWVKFCPKKGADVDKIWTVRDGVIHCLGKPHGYIRTEQDYANYRLHVEWRWTAKPTNSGVLLHKQGPDRVWPKCVEAQLKHHNAGDFWLLTKSTITVNGKQVGPKMYANAKKRGDHNEKPPGEWNAYDITCDGDTVRLVVNGRVMNEGTDAEPSSGAICLQSEGSPIEFRNVYLQPLKEK